MKKALITGITGQDGSYLAEFLLSKGYEVHGIIRRASTFNTHRIDHIFVDSHSSDVKLFPHYGDLSDAGVITDILWNVRPDEIYHLGAQSHVAVSFDMPEYTGNIVGLGTTRILEGIRRSGIKAKFYQASSSEMFGSSKPPQNEQSPFCPRSPYAAAKLYAYWMAVNYRQGYDMFACNGILFNHESPRRGEIFVTRKITRAIAAMRIGKQKRLYLGNLDAKRDWGFAPEYIEVMWKILQQDNADDYVIGTGQSHSVREFVEKSFSYAGVEIEWHGEGVEEEGIVKSISKEWKGIISEGDAVVKVDSKYFRPIEVQFLHADSSKAKKNLGWQPRVSFDELIKIMVDYDLKFAKINPPGDGIKISESKGFDYTKHDFSNYQKSKE